MDPALLDNCTWPQCCDFGAQDMAPMSKVKAVAIDRCSKRAGDHVM
jgi:hypothetical protein